MSLIDKIIDALTPKESEEDRRAVRENASTISSGDDWLFHVLTHHGLIEQGFLAIRSSPAAHRRKQALRRLSVLLMGHAIAEEAVIYPVLRDIGERSHCEIGYEEQGRIKLAIASLEKLDPMSEAFLKSFADLEHLVRHHMYKEERDWLLALHAKAPIADQYMMTARYLEEYHRYVGETESDASPGDQILARQPLL